ncbi:MAG: transcriptional repressor NrdR [Oscillospiraceae bacterium]|nr:transcriptional repressor NrdR [Oscillospiraceae bacterium]
MRCPFCGEKDTRVLDSRPSEMKIRRRRECENCQKRFTTYEIVEMPMLMVEKKDGSIQPFDRNKLMAGIFNAIKKRPVTASQVQAIVDAVESQYSAEMRTSISSSEIGNMVMDKLRVIDPVAYIRFASVYQDFSDVAGFINAVSELSE